MIIVLEPLGMGLKVMTWFLLTGIQIGGQIDKQENLSKSTSNFLIKYSGTLLGLRISFKVLRTELQNLIYPQQQQ